MTAWETNNVALLVHKIRPTMERWKRDTCQWVLRIKNFDIKSSIKTRFIRGTLLRTLAGQLLG